VDASDASGATDSEHEIKTVACRSAASKRIVKLVGGTVEDADEDADDDDDDDDEEEEDTGDNRASCDAARSVLSTGVIRNVTRPGRAATSSKKLKTALYIDKRDPAAKSESDLIKDPNLCSRIPFSPSMRTSNILP
jgi:hypothetical protein